MAVRARSEVGRSRPTDDHTTRSEAVKKSAYEGPRAPLRVMQIVEALAESPQGISLADLARLIDIPKTSLLNHLRVLVSSGHVAQSAAGYVLGPASIRLGTMIGASFGPMAAIGPFVKQLAKDSGETALCGMLDEETSEVIYVQVHEGDQPIRYSPPPGTRRPLYCSGLGRALLCMQDEAFISEYLKTTEFERFNQSTVTSRPQLRKLLVQERAGRVAVSIGERIADLGAVAAPVIAPHGQVRYAIGVTLPVTRLIPSRARLTRLVSAAAERASWALGS